MADTTADFGTGLRAHLGLEDGSLEPMAQPVTQPEPVAVVEPPAESEPSDAAHVQALVAFEEVLLERERELMRREASLAGRAGSLLAAAPALYDEVLGGGNSPQNDELAQLRRRKTVA